MSDVARLAVPLGLILSRTGLEQLMARSRRGTGITANHSAVAPPIKRKSLAMASPGRRASMSGGSSTSVKRAISPVKLGSKVTARKITTPEIKAKAHAKAKAKTKVKVASNQSSPIKKVTTTSATSTATRNTRIRKHFQEIAKKVQEIFAKARTDKLVPTPKSAKLKNHGR